MAVVTAGAWKVLDGREGVDLNNPLASVSFGTNPYPVDTPGPPANLGDRVQAMNDSEWVFVKASTTVTQYNAIAIDASFAANNLNISLATSNTYMYGLALFNATLVNTGDYFWAAVRCGAGGRANFIGTAVAGAKVYVTANAGILTTSVPATNTPQLQGLAFAITGAASATPNEVIMSGYAVAVTSLASV